MIEGRVYLGVHRVITPSAVARILSAHRRYKFILGERLVSNAVRTRGTRGERDEAGGGEVGLGGVKPYV